MNHRVSSFSVLIQIRIAIVLYILGERESSRKKGDGKGEGDEEVPLLHPIPFHQSCDVDHISPCSAPRGVQA